MADSRNRSSTDPVLQAVAACLSHYAKPGDLVTVAYSGGLDSTVLLHAVKHQADDLRLSVSALHVHHGLSVNADMWAQNCTGVCEHLGIPILVKRVRVPTRTGEGIEAAARKLRHKALLEHSADWILYAHHADDQAETVLHNLLRGSGVRGAAAMPGARGRILRPLLSVERSRLASYAEVNRLDWNDDESNADLRYTRNFLRHELIPKIESRFPAARAQLADAARRFGEADALLDELATLDLGTRQAEFPMPLMLFRTLSEARAKNLLRALLGRSNVQAPDERRFNEFVRQLQYAANHRNPRLDLGPYSLWCEAGSLHIKIAD